MPAEFMESIRVWEEEKEDKLEEYKLECHRKGIPVGTPKAKESYESGQEVSQGSREVQFRKKKSSKQQKEPKRTWGKGKEPKMQQQPRQQQQAKQGQAARKAATSSPAGRQPKDRGAKRSAAAALLQLCNNAGDEHDPYTSPTGTEEVPKRKEEGEASGMCREPSLSA